MANALLSTVAWSKTRDWEIKSISGLTKSKIIFSFRDFICRQVELILFSPSWFGIERKIDISGINQSELHLQVGLCYYFRSNFKESDLSFFIFCVCMYIINCGWPIEPSGRILKLLNQTKDRQSLPVLS